MIYISSIMECLSYPLQATQMCIRQVNVNAVNNISSSRSEHIYKIITYAQNIENVERFHYGNDINMPILQFLIHGNVWRMESKVFWHFSIDFDVHRTPYLHFQSIAFIPFEAATIQCLFFFRHSFAHRFIKWHTKRDGLTLR